MHGPVQVNHSDAKPGFSGKNTSGDSHGKRIPPYQNTIGQRKPITWVGPPVGNLDSHVVGPR